LDQLNSASIETEILKNVARGEDCRLISQEIRHCRDLIREIRDGLIPPNDLDTLEPGGHSRLFFHKVQGVRRFRVRMRRDAKTNRGHKKLRAKYGRTSTLATSPTFRWSRRWHSLVTRFSRYFSLCRTLPAMTLNWQFSKRGFLHSRPRKIT
jgi:hypothetical protein